MTTPRTLSPVSSLVLVLTLEREREGGIGREERGRGGGGGREKERDSCVYAIDTYMYMLIQKVYQYTQWSCLQFHL